MNQLARALFPLGRAVLAVKVFRDDHLRREHRPGLRDFDILLLENHFARRRR